MALEKKTFTLGINDCKIFPITTDTTSSYVCGAAIDVPTAQSFSVELEIESKELNGDEKLVDIYSKANKVKFSVDYGSLDLDLQAAIMGGSVVSSGSTPSQRQRFGYSLGVNDKFFQLAFKIDCTDKLSSNVDDVHIHIMKAKIDTNSFTGDNGEYSKLKFAGSGINTTNVLSAGQALYIDLNETASELTAIVSA